MGGVAELRHGMADALPASPVLPKKENPMPNYCIMRVEKRKRAALYGLQIEANRTAADHEKGLKMIMKLL